MNPINPAASGDSTSPRNVYQVVTEQIIRQLAALRSEEHTSELQSRLHLVCRLLLEKKNNYTNKFHTNPAEHRQAYHLAPFDYGSNSLIYNISNLPYHLKCNCNGELNIFSLSGIKPL